MQKENEFSCDCRGTNYTGDTCGNGIIRIPSIPVLTQGQRQMVTISTGINITSTVRVTVRGGGTSAYVTLTPQSPSANFRVLPKEAGTFKLTYKTDNIYVIQPAQSTVLVRGESEPVTPVNHYFTTLQQRIGVLRKSCCGLKGSLRLSCTENTRSVSLTAAYEWKTKGKKHSAPGVIFAEGGELSVPVAINGIEIEEKAEEFRSRLPVNPDFTRCNAAEELCGQNPPFDDSCYCYDFSQSDASDFLNARSLGLTYMQQIGGLLPQWLNISVDLDNVRSGSTTSEYDFLAFFTNAKKRVRNQEGCGSINPKSKGIYSVLRFDKTLSAEIDGDAYSYIEGSYEVSDSDTMCFVVNMCEGIDSLVYIQPSQPIQTILSREYLQYFTTRAWSFQLNSITVSRVPQMKMIENMFWSSSRFFSPMKIMYDLALSTNTEALFRSESLNISVFFSGDAMLEHRVC